MTAPNLPILPTYMLVKATGQTERDMEVLDLVLAAGPDHFHAISKGEHPGIGLRIVMTSVQLQGLIDVLGRTPDLPGHRPN